ncbi:DUF7289 family protein [Halorarius halobius]|uniref:DUF7289 family protein n=1 Tax=Halorarius halobius TaxID=2962671 RepID=UPI0020CF149C|nr:hypothetical protein [Halorarius halobius]
MGDRGISDVIGFVLVFGLVLSTVSVVYVFGIGGLQDTRDLERVNNAERAFDVLANNLADLYERDAPSRATEVKLADADLGFGTPTVVNVSVTNGGTTNYTRKEIDPLVYTADTATLEYVNGAVIRMDRDSGTTLRRPRTQFIMQAGDRVALFPIIETRAGDGPQRIGGSTTTLIRAQTVTSDVLLAKNDSVAGAANLDVTLNVTASDTTEAAVWAAYLEGDIPDSWDTDGDGDVCARTGTKVTCTLTVDQLYVPRTGITVRLA